MINKPKNKQKFFKLSLVTLGCNKNQTDSEFLLAGLSRSFEITGNIGEAEILVISPCAFLKEARVEAEKYISELSKYKKQNCKCLIVTGCYSQFLKKELFDGNKNIDIVIGLCDVDTFVESINNFFSNKTRGFVDGNNNVYGLFDNNVTRINSHPNYAYLKISDGCNNRCSYCLIPTIRGEYRSRSKEVILAEAEALISQGIKEINVISQDIGAYGTDIYGKQSLIELLDAMASLGSGKKFWLRLLYMHPKHINRELVELIKSHKNICKYIDLPIQHINDQILQKMNRKITKFEILEKIFLLKKEIPNVVIRTTFILGFPGETESQFRELCDFVGEGYFDKVGVFTYSREKGTKSYDFSSQISNDKKNARARELMDIQKSIALKNNKKLVSKVLDFLPEEIIDENTVKGRIATMAPEVDGNVFVEFKESFDPSKFNKFFKVKICEYTDYDLYAGIVQNKMKKACVPET